MRTVWENLRQPPAGYRPVPFWSWNDRLETAELKRQIEEMHKAGIGGFFMHARSGLETPYMGGEWMAAVQACIEKARELGMSPWLYDENGWPSGFGSGAVPALGLRFQQKKLKLERGPFPDGAAAEGMIASYACTEEGGFRLLREEEAARADLRVSYEVNPYYIDTLSPEAVRAFLDSTYEVYWRQFGAEFGGDIPGMFTDEPQFARGGLPWSFGMEQVFWERSGYDLANVLPWLFLDGEGSSKARYDYWSCVTAMFTEAYAKQIGDWCADKGWSLTGHVVDEQELMQQVTSVGDPMAFYEYMQVPGMDWLGRFTGEEPVVPKQVSSAARQLGRKRTITETFGCAGWNVSLADLKRIGEWQFVHGINMICQHLQAYTLRGIRKRDYPPSLFFQQPWWEEYRALNDYFARLSLLLSEGVRQAEVLLLHPVRTAWVKQRGEDSSGSVPCHRAFARLSRWMCQSFIGHDYGSESIIGRHGRISGGRFIVGEAAYRAVVIPPCATLDRATVELLRQYAEAGGCLIAFEPYPALISGAPDAEGVLERLMAGAVRPEWSREGLAAAVEAAVPPSVRVKGYASGAETDLVSDDVHVQVLELDGAQLYYVAHTGEEALGPVTVELLRPGGLRRIDLETGEELPLAGAELTADGVRVPLTLLAGQSHMLKLVPGGEGAAEAASGKAGTMTGRGEQAAAGCTVAYVEPGPVWSVSHAELNSLTLDTCRCRVEGGEWSAETPVVLLQEQLLAYGKPVRVELAFEFRVGFDPAADRELYLVLERPETVAIELNGRQVAPADCGWWRDTSFRKMDIRGMVTAGVNRVVLGIRFCNSPETYEALERARRFEGEGNKLAFETDLESVYLLGAFGVESEAAYTYGERRAVWTDGPFVLTEPPREVEGGRDLVPQGFPFFAGRLRLCQTVEMTGGEWTKAVWSFGEAPDAIVSRLFVNGREVKAFLWEPFEADITAYIREGANLIELELAGSCRNLLGPHHHIKGEVYKIGPDSFKDKPGWTDKDLAPGTCIYLDRYAFVRFGLCGTPHMELRI